MDDRLIYEVYVITHGIRSVNRRLIGTYKGRAENIAIRFIENERWKLAYMSRQKQAAIPIIRYSKGDFPKDYKYMLQKRINRIEIITSN